MRPFAMLTMMLVMASCGAEPTPAPNTAADQRDARAEAQRHFKAGMAKIAARDFDGGIAEFSEAQRISPHPNVLFNIAKAHEDAGRPAEAVRYYRDYLSAGPADRADVEATIMRLEHR